MDPRSAEHGALLVSHRCLSVWGMWVNGWVLSVRSQNFLNFFWAEGVELQLRLYNLAFGIVCWITRWKKYAELKSLH
ncbi:uncharacterized protein BDR25DRAFT_95505 [Lindgomyces ingoldianus]|uniref:Uncharacterized protein n=1 Tax=Lindgomyces ingoldianus TaxID=673940 RepID=A0ACB6QEJ0_9PLEO|nr:uncharacterized protein BDR25DRAFT_95505 [Lindgomyces ingoldianus]KAF2464556.1 hypothetical protein BDR25DRAFT_95505 [Lindgomyces ingoldianus]